MFEKRVYASYNEKLDIRNKSSSGGIFYSLAEYVLKLDGIVYGVAFEENLEYLYFKRVDSIDGLKEIMGSKYIQARVGRSYIDVERDLKDGKYVLFSGTPCQVNALCSYLNKDYERLICVDIVCHGVPSEMIWEKYFNYIKMLHRINPVSIKFRDKRYGWKNYGISIEDGKKKIFIPFVKDTYMHFFLNNLSIRPSCFNCTAREKRKADITLADFWGIEDIDISMKCSSGVSLVIIRTQKGNNIFKSLNDLINKEELYIDAVKYNPSEYKSVCMPSNRSDFYREAIQMNYNELVDKYYKRNISVEIKTLIKQIIYRWGIRK